MSVSPVYLQLKADVRFGIFKPLDRDSQTNRHLEAKRERKRDGNERDSLKQCFFIIMIKTV